MKNIHLIPTHKPSKLYRTGAFILLDSKVMPHDTLETINQHIYITSDEEIKEGDWFYDGDGELCKYTSDYVVNPNGWNDNKKITLTTDQDLIKDGVQAIDDEFLEWFIKNPSCEKFEVKKGKMRLNCDGEEIGFPDMYLYKIIIPQKEPKPIYQQIIDIVGGEDRFRQIAGIKPKQETLEEDAERLLKEMKKTPMTFVPDEKMYSEEDMHKAYCAGSDFDMSCLKGEQYYMFKEWFEQFKKK
jgi:hypothetical protein